VSRLGNYSEPEYRSCIGSARGIAVRFPADLTQDTASPAETTSPIALSDALIQAE
jgi:hypothetical protein